MFNNQVITVRTPNRDGLCGVYTDWLEFSEDLDKFHSKIKNSMDDFIKNSKYLKDGDIILPTPSILRRRVTNGLLADGFASVPIEDAEGEFYLEIELWDKNSSRYFTE